MLPNAWQGRLGLAFIIPNGGIDSEGTGTLVVWQSYLTQSHEILPSGNAGEMFRQHVGNLCGGVDILDSNAITGTNLVKPIDIDPMGSMDVSQSRSTTLD